MTSNSFKKDEKKSHRNRDDYDDFSADDYDDYWGPGLQKSVENLRNFWLRKSEKSVEN